MWKECKSSLINKQGGWNKRGGWDVMEKTTPGPRLMRIHLVRYSTNARYEKYSNIHLVRIFVLSE